ncbi:type II secretion system F family protein [Cohnella panacarvi]|uniref:type II secretion system F family protein n=1 Tax=Cohnella panacarvi TaxID=400776 RepID=UPI00047D27D3|nr:type II secretion system F family protein [Cohnella panacarvi]
MMIGWIGICCVMLLVLYAVLISRVAVARKGRLGGIKPLVDPFIYVLAVRTIADRIEPLLIRPRYALAQLNGGTCSRDRLLSFAGESVGLGYAAWLAFGCVAWVTDNDSLAVLGIVVCVCVPLLRARELRNRVAMRRQRIVMELPELLGKLLLIVNAGDTVLRALTRCVEQQPPGRNPLYDELKSALAAMKRGESMAAALEEMGRRCAVPEVKLFASTLLINARRGGEVFVPALRELTRQMWEKRKAAVRTLGEQASSKLVFPLTLVFLCIMVLVGAPALLMF